MDYQTFQPQPDLAALVKCYWTLEVPKGINAPKQRIIPDGCIEIAFLLGDDIKRYTSETDFILQPRAMVLGQINDAFYIEPTGYVKTFAIRFYPYGFANFVKVPIETLANKETPIQFLFEEDRSKELEQAIADAADTKERIIIAEKFLLQTLNHKSSIDTLVKSTIDILFTTKGSAAIHTILKENPSQRRQLERNFLKQIGISPKQLGKVIRLQAALKELLAGGNESLSSVAYENQYYDQAHFIRDFKEFTGTTPNTFLTDEQLALSALFYKNE
jgi:AraC-like DNA-binding protein